MAGNRTIPRAKSDKGNDAPGTQDESAYPDDDYWHEDVARHHPKEPPPNSGKPENGFRWQPTEDKPPKDKPADNKSNERNDH